MNDKLKMLIASITTLLAALGAFSLRVEYTRATEQEKIGRLIVSLSKGCDKESK